MNDALQVISDAAQRYPDSRNLAQVRFNLLARCGFDDRALEACEAFLAKFGVDTPLLDQAVGLRKNTGIYDRLGVAGAESVSLCMIVKNEERNLPACLASLKPVADEMIIVDTGSTDRTVDLATAFGARVLHFPWNGSFSDARNYSLDQARGAWILVMDADEVLAAQDYETVRHAIRTASGSKTAWSVMTRNYTRLHPHGWVANNGSYPAEEMAEGWHPSNKVRLFPNDTGVRFVGEVHEMIEQTALKAGYQIRDSSFVVHHYGGLTDSQGGDQAKKLAYFELGKKKLAEQPDDLPSIGELAVQAAELELYVEAISLWNSFLQLAPDAPVALFNKGFALMRLNRFTEALDVTLRALEIEPFHKEAAFNYGVCSLYVGDLHEATRRLKNVQSQHSGHPPLLAVLTVLYLADGLTEPASECLDALQQINYSISGFIDGRIAVLRSLGRDDRADSIVSGITARQTSGTP
jgi:tetratricopeptide (TPR) repeat protein